MSGADLPLPSLAGTGEDHLYWGSSHEEPHPGEPVHGRLRYHNGDVRIAEQDLLALVRACPECQSELVRDVV